MSFKGKFTWFTSLNQGGRKAISFTLRNDNLLQPEIFDAAIVDGSNVIPTKRIYQMKLRAGETAVFNIDNGQWDWAQGDFFAIVNKKGDIKKRWDLNLPTLAPGECKECHGTHKCAHCGGHGKILNRSQHTYEMCTVCRGTGICQTCFIPTRHNSPSSPTYSPVSVQQQQTNTANRDRIQQQIQDLQYKIMILDQEMLNMQRNGQTVSLHSIYQDKLRMKYLYEIEKEKLMSLIQ